MLTSYCMWATASPMLKNVAHFITVNVETLRPAPKSSACLENRFLKQFHIRLLKKIFRNRKWELSEHLLHNTGPQNTLLKSRKFNKCDKKFQIAKQYETNGKNCFQCCSKGHIVTNCWNNPNSKACCGNQERKRVVQKVTSNENQKKEYKGLSVLDYFNDSWEPRDNMFQS